MLRFKIYNGLASLFCLFISSQSIASDSNRANNAGQFVYEIVSKVIDEYTKAVYDPKISYYVIKKLKNDTADPNFHTVTCFASDYQGYTGKCSVNTLPDGKLLLADCFTHNSVCYSCRLARFNADGTQDKSFKLPFSFSQKEMVNGSPEHEIKDIREVKLMENGMISVEGDFISPLIGWNRKQAQSEIGDDSGKPGILVLSKTGKIVSFTPKSR